MLVYKDGEYLEEPDGAIVTEEAEAQEVPADPLTEMASAMAKATSLAQMRAAAKAFLEQTGEYVV